MTYEEARAQLPADAKWFASFGLPGEGGYREFHRTPDGQWWRLTNGPWDARRPFTWAVNADD